MSSTSPSPQSEPAIVGMSRSAAELVFWLRRSETDIVNLMAEINDRYQSLRSIISNLGMEERTSFEAELPGLVHRILELYDHRMADQEKSSISEATVRYDPPPGTMIQVDPYARKVRDNPQA